MIHLFAPQALLAEGFAHDVRIGVADGMITSVTPGAAFRPGDENVEGVLLPGMPNLHSHAFQRAFAGLTAVGGGDFWSWRQAMFRVASRITPEVYSDIAAWVGKELLKGGYTALTEFHYLHHQPDGASYAPAHTMASAVAEGAQRAGIGLTLLVGVYEMAGLDGAPLTGGQRRFRNGLSGALEMAAGLREVGIVTGLALHSLRAVPAAAVREAAASFAGQGPIHIHAAEQRAEVQACLETLGAPPVAWLLDNVQLDAGWCLVHATHATAPEIAGAARAGAVIGLCPTTEADLGDGIFPLCTLLSHTGTFGIGSDSNVCLDAFSELRLLEYGQRLSRERRNVAASGPGHCGRILWQAACQGGAAASGRPIGVIASGHCADLIVIEPTPESRHAAPDFQLDAAIFAAGAPPVRDVMVAGHWQVRDRRHCTEDALDRAYHTALRDLAA